MIFKYVRLSANKKRADDKLSTALQNYLAKIDSNYFLAYFLLNLSTLPAESSIFCFPVKKG